jgi:purine-binding chemotaxis protein CheW
VASATGLAAGSGQLSQYLTFMLGGEVFAIGILAIKEIIEYGNLTEGPCMHGFIRGIGKVDGKFVIILNVDHVLSLDEMSSVAGVNQGTAVAG